MLRLLYYGRLFYYKKMGKKRVRSDSEPNVWILSLIEFGVGCPNFKSDRSRMSESDVGVGLRFKTRLLVGLESDYA